MGADAFYVYFGVRYTVQSDNELEQIELSKDPRQFAAQKAHLQTCTGRPTDGRRCLLLVGTKIGHFGIENEMRAAISEEEMRQLVEDTKRRLIEAGIHEPPQFQFQVVAQY